MEGLVMLSQSFWNGRRVLITGHTGFKGAWLWQWLSILGADLYGFAMAPDTDPSLFAHAGLRDCPGSRIGDIRDRSAMAEALRAAAPEVVLHLAAQSLVRRSYRDPIGTLETNTLGTAYLLDAITHTPSVRCAVIATSDKCYRPGPDAHAEDDALGGVDPYSASKACAEIVVDCWRSLAQLAGSAVGIASVRAGNVIGGGDWAPDRLIPDCFRAWERGESVPVRNPEAIRPWQHVLDALSGYLILAERLFDQPASFAEAWNFGPAGPQQETVRAVVDRLAAAWGPGAEWRAAPDSNAPEQPALAIDSAKARGRLRWRPALPLNDAVAWTAEWHRRLLAGESAVSLCASQIAAWMARAQ